MIMPQSSDRVQSAVCSDRRLKLLRVDVVDSARMLAQRQGAGPTASLVLSEALTAVALLGGDGLRAGDEGCRLEISVDGPVRGLCVERLSPGLLRGYIEQTDLAELDSREETDTREALGERAEAEIRRIRAGRVVETTTLTASPALPETVLRRYLNLRRRRPVVIQVTALAYDAYLELARGLLIESLPGASQADVGRFETLFERGELMELLEAEPSLASLCETLGLTNARLGPSVPLRFGCRCADAYVDTFLHELPPAAFEALCRQTSPQPVCCRMCGARYPIEAERLAAARAARGA